MTILTKKTPTCGTVWYSMEQYGTVWYSIQLMGKNKLGELVKTMSEKRGLTGPKVNHSARKKNNSNIIIAFKGRGNNSYAAKWRASRADMEVSG